MGGDLVFSHPLGQEVGETLGQPAGVHEDQRGPVLGHVRGDAVEDLSPLLVGGHGLELALGKLDGEVQLAAVAQVHDAARRRKRLRSPTC